MYLLAIETATEACSAALFVNGKIYDRFLIAPRGHADLVLAMCDELLAEAGVAKSQLTALGFGRGPGSFTGVRIATGVVQGLAFALDVPVVPVSTLAALAQGAAREHGWSHVLAAMDARMGEVYWALFETGEDGLVKPAGPERITAPEAVAVLDETWCAVGSALAAYGDRINVAVRAREVDRLPHAHDVALLAAAGYLRGEARSAEQAVPVYLRDEVAKRSL